MYLSMLLLAKIPYKINLRYISYINSLVVFFTWYVYSRYNFSKRDGNSNLRQTVDCFNKTRTWTSGHT